MSPTANRRRLLGLDLTNRAQKYFILLEFVLFGLTMVYLLYLMFGTINGVVAGADATTQEEWVQVFSQINFLLLVRISILFVVVFFINVMLGLFFLHRLTGPMVRTRSILSQIADGEIPNTKVTLRKGDFPTELADELNRAIGTIRQMKEGRRRV